MSPAAPDGDALIGRVLAARYRIEARLARGGMGWIYRAVDERLERPVAVKLLAPPYADDPVLAERFVAEARTAASFSHPNLAHVYDSGSDDGIHFMVLELLERHRSLRHELGRHAPLPPSEAGRVALDVLAGLEPLHAHGLVHCDVKPGNVMIGAEGTKLIDFGITRGLGRSPEAATSVGSLHAMSPEQLRGEALAPASDLFAVGVLLYEALTGVLPFPGATPGEVAAAQARPPEPPSRLAPGIDPRLDGVVVQALRLDPARRFASARAMTTALRSALGAQEGAGAPASHDDTTQVHAVAPAAPAGGEPQPADPRPDHAPVQERRRPGATTVLAIVAVAAVPALVAGIILLGPPAGDPRRTQQPAAGETPGGTPTLAPGTVRVPDTIGMSEPEAQAAAQEAGLAWRLEWRVAGGETPGVYDQEPAPGEIVERGSRFVMYAYRSE